MALNVRSGFFKVYANQPQVGTNVPAQCFKVPDDVSSAGFSLDVLPDPFKFLNGTTVRTKADWACRREQLRAMFLKYEQGDKPPKPKTLTGSFTGNTLTVMAGNGAKNITFRVPIKRPSGPGPFPAIITLGLMATIPVPAGVATINLPVEVIAKNDKRAQGVFYDLYGKNAPASTLVAWAWAASRVLDLLGTLPAIGIDAVRVGVTGCSRFGKGALVAGALDDRLALTIAQESGCGGDGCWRAAQALKNGGEKVEVAENIAGTSWVSTAFRRWSAPATIGRFPLDHHELAGLVAPRGLYSTSNMDYKWLGGPSSFQCMTAANKIFAALGVKGNQGYSVMGGHSHCSFPAAQVPELNAYINKFLLKKAVNPSGFTNKAGYKVEAKWTPWTVPTLV
jgi:hypothetical protein